MYVYDNVNTTAVVVLFCILYTIFLYNYKTWNHQRLKKKMKSSSPVSRAFGRDKLVSEHRFRRFLKSLRLMMYLHSIVLAYCRCSCFMYCL